MDGVLSGSQRKCNERGRRIAHMQANRVQCENLNAEHIHFIPVSPKNAPKFGAVNISVPELLDILDTTDEYNSL